MEEVKTKVCPKCGEEKPLTEEFWYIRHYAYGKSYYEGPCRICHKTRAKELRNNIRKEKKREKENIPIPTDKTCSYCGETKPLKYKYWVWDCKFNKPYSSHRCRECTRIYNLEYKQKAKRIRARERKKIKERVYRQAIDDKYVKDELRKKIGVLTQDITPEMIELKRVQLQLFRATKQLKEEWDELSRTEVNGDQRCIGEVSQEGVDGGGSAGVCVAYERSAQVGEHGVTGLCH